MALGYEKDYDDPHNAHCTIVDIYEYEGMKHGSYDIMSL